VKRVEIKHKNHEWQLSNLKLSKHIKELGVKQESLFYWSKVYQRYRNGNVDEDSGSFALMKEDDYFITLDGNLYEYTCGSELKLESYSAFTVAELGELLKDKDEYKYFLWGYHLPKRDCFDLVLQTAGREKILWDTRAITEADARAKMLIHLIEEGLVILNGK